MKEIKPEELNENPFKLIGKDWLLVTAKKEDRTNMMTASWGAVGIMWNKPCATIYIRNSRFTKEFIDKGTEFSLCVLPEEMRSILTICGKKSGRDTDKVKETGLTVQMDGNVPYFKESRLVIKCKKLFAQELTSESFIEQDLYEKNYPTKDNHVMYIAEITKIMAE